MLLEHNSVKNSGNARTFLAVSCENVAMKTMLKLPSENKMGTSPPAYVDDGVAMFSAMFYIPLSKKFEKLKIRLCVGVITKKGFAPKTPFKV